MDETYDPKISASTILASRDLPALQLGTSRASRDSQRHFTRVLAAQLLLLCMVAVAGSLTIRIGSVDWAGVLAAIAFLAAAAAEGYLLRNKPDQAWYSSRAAAESVKTLAWRYAVRAKPFDDSTASSRADDLFITRIREILTELGSAEIAPTNARLQISDAMRNLRASSLTERKRQYVDGRIDDQQDWYTSKALQNRQRAAKWRWALIVVEGSGGVLAVLKAVGLFQLDLFGILAVFSAAGVTWLQSKQHQTLAFAYSIAAQDLASSRSLIGSIESEKEWSRFVDSTEGAVSREHTVWRSTRTPQGTP